MSLMGVVMLAGIAVSNSILIVEFANHLLQEGKGVRDAIITSCRVRLRPILMTSLATVIGLLPMALKLGEGSESYAPLAQALIGGLTLSVLLTVFWSRQDSFWHMGKGKSQWRGRHLRLFGNQSSVRHLNLVVTFDELKSCRLVQRKD